MEQLNFKYYCYVCQKYFYSKTETVSCLYCDSCAIEEAGVGHQQQSSDEGLSKFEIYEVRNQQQPQQVLGTLQNVVHPRPQPFNSLNSVIRDSVRVIQGTITYSMDFSQNSTLFNLMRQLLGDGHTPHRATQEQISKLQKIQYVKECSICQSVEQGQEEKVQEVKKSEQSGGFKLKCNHTFHQSCIKPWFERANTCPVCRTKID